MDSKTAKRESAIQFVADIKSKSSDEWKKGPKISMQDLLQGKNGVEKITIDEILGKKKSNNFGVKKSQIMGFGKYKGKTWTEIEEEDSNYWEWVLENVPWFKKLVDKERSK